MKNFMKFSYLYILILSTPSLEINIIFNALKFFTVYNILCTLEDRVGWGGVGWGGVYG